MDGFVVTQLLYVASELGLAEALADGPRTGAELAAAVGADAGALTRVLRGLALEDVVSEEDGRFALTPVGEALVPMAGALRVRGQVYYGGAAGLLDAVRHGGTAFERTYGAPFFDHLAAHPDQEAAFQASMAGRSEQEAGDVVAAYDFSGLASLVDVGGGRGVLLAAISRRRRTSRPRCRPRRAVEAARASTSTARVRRGRLLRAVPAGADAYLLSRVLHDWDDEDALRILAVCRAAMRAAAPAAGRRRDPARAREGRAVRDPHGPPHAPAARRARAHRGRVPRPARRGRVRGRGASSRPARPPGLSVIEAASERLEHPAVDDELRAGRAAPSAARRGRRPRRRSPAARRSARS